MLGRRLWGKSPTPCVSTAWRHLYRYDDNIDYLLTNKGVFLLLATGGWWRPSCSSRSKCSRCNVCARFFLYRASFLRNSLSLNLVHINCIIIDIFWARSLFGGKGGRFGLKNNAVLLDWTCIFAVSLIAHLNWTALTRCRDVGLYLLTLETIS